MSRIALRKIGTLLVVGSCFALSSVAVSSVAVAVDPSARPEAAKVPTKPNAQRFTANKVVTQEAATHNSDVAIANCLAIGAQEEIALAKVAKEKAQTQQVRDFAEMMIHDHTAALEEMRKFGATAVAIDLDAGRKTSNGLRPQDIAGQPELSTNNQRGVDFLEVKRGIAQRGLMRATREWNEKSSAEAEMAYTGGQIAAHQTMIDTQQVVREYATPELQQVIDQQTKTAESHLGRARDLIHQLAQSERTSSERDAK